MRKNNKFKIEDFQLSEGLEAVLRKGHRWHLGLVWSVLCVFDIFFAVMIPAVVVMTVWNGLIVWKVIKQKNSSILGKSWLRLCILPMHFLFGGFFVSFGKLMEQI